MSGKVGLAQVWKKGVRKHVVRVGREAGGPIGSHG